MNTVWKPTVLEGLDIGEHGMEAYSGFLKEGDATGFSEGQGSIGRF